MERQTVSNLSRDELTRSDDGVGPNHVLNAETLVVIDPVRPRVRPNEIVNVFLRLLGVYLRNQERRINIRISLRDPTTITEYLKKPYLSGDVSERAIGRQILRDWNGNSQFPIRFTV